MTHVLEKVGISDLSVAYQPIVHLDTGEVFAYEALVRTTAKGMYPPALIQKAIDENCCGELGRCIRKIAVEGCWFERLFLNIHPSELNEGWLVRPDDPMFNHDHDVYLEITESAPLGSDSWHVGSLDEIRSKGVNLAVDDFGAGYSNLLYLAALSPDIVKLDRTLITEMHRDARKISVVRAMVQLCHELGSKVVAEGIETMGELDAVLSCNVDFGQGYLIGRPQQWENGQFLANPNSMAAPTIKKAETKTNRIVHA